MAEHAANNSIGNQLDNADDMILATKRIAFAIWRKILPRL